MPFPAAATDLDNAVTKAQQCLWTIFYDGGRSIATDVESFRTALFEDGGSVQSNLSNLSEFLQQSVRAWNVALRELQTRQIAPEVWEYVVVLRRTLLAIRNAVGNSGAGMPDDVLADWNAILNS